MAASFRNHVQILSLTLLYTVIFTVQSVVAVDLPEYSPSPASPSISPSFPDTSPPAPPPSDSSPALSPPVENSSPEKSPSPEIASDVNHANPANYGNIESEESSGGMKMGQKAGVALAVIAFACVLGIGTIVYKKRQQNIRRSQFGYAARRELL